MTDTEHQACATPLEDIRRGVLAHYEEAASAAHCWHSVIPRAINFYFDAEEAKRRPVSPEAAPPRATTPEPDMADVEDVIRRATALGMKSDAAPLNTRLIASVQRLTPKPEELAALKAAAFRVHSETDEGRSVMRAVCVCGFEAIGAPMPLCDLLRRIIRDAEA